MCLGNLDLGHITTGYSGDPMKKRPFNSIFRWDNILAWWQKVGFIPMLWDAVNNPKVSKEAGVGGPIGEKDKRV